MASDGSDASRTAARRGAPTSPAPGGSARTGPVGPVGRSDVVDAVRAVVADAARGRSSVLVVTGPAGIGKSTLVARAVDGPDAPPARVVRLRGSEAGPPWPLEGVVALLLELRRHEPTAEAAERALAVWREGPTGGSDGSALPLAVATHDALTAHHDAAGRPTEEGEPGPLVVVVEEAEWLDPDSARVLAFVARRLHDDPVGMVVTHRGPLDGSPWAGLPATAVPPLDPDEAEALVTEASPVPVAGPVLDLLARACGGNPVALREVVAALTPDQLAGRAPVDDPLPIGPLLERSALAPTASLADGERTALLVVAAARHAPAAVVQQALDHLGAAAALPVLSERGLVTSLGGDDVVVTDPLLRAALLRAAAPDERRRAHAALAAALEADADGDGDASADPALAWHRGEAAAGPDEGVARALAEAAAAVHRRGGPGSASLYLERAARLTPDPARRAVRFLLAAGAAREAGATALGTAARDAAERLLADLDDVPSAAAALRARQDAAVLFDEGRPGAGIAVLTDAARRLGPHDPHRAADVLLDAVPVALRIGRVEVAAELAETAQRAVDGGADADADADADVDPVLGHRLRLARAAAATAAGVAGGEEALHAALDRPPGPVDTFDVECAALATIWSERLADARVLLDRAEARCRAAGAVGPLAVVRALQAFAALRGSRLGDAAAAAGEATQLAGDTGRLGVQPFADAVAGVAAAMRGEQEACEAAAERLLVAAATANELRWDVPARAALGLMALGAGRPDDTVAHLFPLVDQAPSRPWLVMWEPDLAEALIRVGRADEARPLVDRLAASGAASGRARAAARRLEGLLAEDPDEGLTCLVEAGDAYAALGAPFGTGRALLNQGALLRRQRRRRDARRVLEDAERIFTAIGADLWARVALTELRATGGGPALADPVTLTPQELQVATMVAGGASNRDVAAALFISTRTVESHLGRIYRKLGVRSRAELAAQARDWSERTSEVAGPGGPGPGPTPG